MVKKKIFISLNDEFKFGHGADLRQCLEESLGESSCAFFQDREKIPDNIFSVTVEELLLSNGVLLDALPSGAQVSPDVLIQFGIAHALGKKSAFLHVKNNSARITKDPSPLVSSYQIDRFDNYLDVIFRLKARVQEMLDQDTPRHKIESYNMSVQSFSVFGADEEREPDLRNAIKKFAESAGWEAKFQSRFRYGHETLSLLDSLSVFISLRPFTIFCLDMNATDEVYIGVGVAIGMGVPFLILQNRKIKLPLSLGGYHGLIEYDSSVELDTALSIYTKDFLSDDVNSWSGSTFSHLLLRADQLISSAKNENDLYRTESLLQAINDSIRTKTPLLYALLGDIYRERYRRLPSKAPKYLEVAREYYSEALKLDANYKRGQDAIAALDRYLQLIDLIERRSYKSIPSLIRLIGEEINVTHYELLRGYLIGEVKNLIEAQQYSQALALLAAIESHDKTDEVKALIKQVLKDASPNDVVEALRDAQDQIDILQQHQNQMVDEIASKDKEISKLSQYIHSLQNQRYKLTQRVADNQSELLMKNEANESFLAQLNSVQERLLNEMERSSEIESERDEFLKEIDYLEKELLWKDRWLDELREQRNTIQAQLSEKDERFQGLKREKDSLEKKFNENLGQLLLTQQEKEDLEVKVTNDKINMRKQLGGQVALVDFGLGWALYAALRGKPYVYRSGQKIPAKRGMIIESGDRVVDENGADSWLITYPARRIPYRKT